MSNHHLALVRDIKDVRGTAKAVLIALADRSNDQGECWPSVATIASDCGFCKSTVKNAIRILKGGGLISSTPRKDPAGDSTSNVYRLRLGGGAGDALGGAGDTPQVGQEMPGGGAGAAPKASMKHKMEPSLLGEEELPLHESTKDHCHEVFNHWQSFKVLPQPREISKERKTKLKARLKDAFFRDNWKQAIAKIAESPFLTGQGPRGWKADIDWLLSPGTVIKVMEGKYDGQPSTEGTNPSTPGTVVTGGRVFR